MSNLYTYVFNCCYEISNTDGIKLYIILCIYKSSYYKKYLFSIIEESEPDDLCVLRLRIFFGFPTEESLSEDILSSDMADLFNSESEFITCRSESESIICLRFLLSRFTTLIAECPLFQKIPWFI